MKLKKIHFPLLALAVALCNNASAQLYIDNAQFTIQTGATVTVQGNVTSNVDILGPGKILLKGSSNQIVNMAGFTIPNLEVDNVANATLNGHAKIGTSLLFTNGKIIAGDYNLTLSDVATVSGQGTGKFVETNGSGQLRKTLTGNVTNYEMPVGSGTNYRPAFITSNGTYSSAYAGVQVKGTGHPNKHPRSTDYLNEYWPITQSGITGTLRASGRYFADFTGSTETDMRSMVYSNGYWSLVNASMDYAADSASALIPASGADLYAMNRFLLSKVKVYLQGAYNPANALMNDNLRTLASFPTTDPYRSAPYSGYFSHTNNSVAESIINPSGVLASQGIPADNIVDWVFVELRTITSPTVAPITQTRAALVQKDGDIVDIDGVSPLYFKNIDSGNYVISIRHRNHIGLSGSPVNFVLPLNLRTPSTPADFTTAAASKLYGTSGTNYAVSTDSKNMLYAGNVSGNGVVRYQGTNGPGATNVSDRVALLTDLGSELATLSTYQRGDVTMNGTTRYQGTNGPGAFNVSDRVFLLTLLGSELATKTQLLPN